MKIFIKCAFFLMFLFLSACSDRPSFVSVKKALELLQKSESLQNVIDVKKVEEIGSYKSDSEFVVNFTFEQHFLLDLQEAAKLMNEVIVTSHPELSANSSVATISHQKNIEHLLLEKYGIFLKGDIRQRNVNLVFKKNEGQWSFMEQRADWKDFNKIAFQKNDTRTHE